MAVLRIRRKRLFILSVMDDEEQESEQAIEIAEFLRGIWTCSTKTRNHLSHTLAGNKKRREGEEGRRIDNYALNHMLRPARGAASLRSTENGVLATAKVGEKRRCPGSIDETQIAMYNRDRVSMALKTEVGSLKKGELQRCEMITGYSSLISKQAICMARPMKPRRSPECQRLPGSCSLTPEDFWPPPPSPPHLKSGFCFGPLRNLRGPLTLPLVTRSSDSLVLANCGAVVATEDAIPMERRETRWREKTSVGSRE